MIILHCYFDVVMITRRVKTKLKDGAVLFFEKSRYYGYAKIRADRKEKRSLDMGSTLETVVFYFLAAFITVFSILTVTTHRMVRSATYLLFVLFGTAGIYFLLGYTFLGSVQIMVYAGGIVVLYVFSILLTSGEGDVIEKLKRSRFLAGLGATVGGAIIVVFITLKHKFIATTDVEPLEVNIKTIGHHMLSGDKYGYLLPFEAVSILLLACIVGGLLIARKR